VTNLFGREIVVSGDINYKDEKGRLVVDISDIVILQFAKQEHIDEIFKVYEVFRARIAKWPDPELDKIIDYCNRMDDKIREAFWKLKNSEKDIFLKMWNEMGGDCIPKEDRLGRRICFIKDLVEGFKEDRKKYAPYLINLGLLR
jgi:hypothetical protein